jgi:hypothetical protein
MRNEDFDLVEIKQGEYWRALENIPDTPIIAGDVLLLESIRDVDKTVHTLVLRTHPGIYYQYVRYAVTMRSASGSSRRIDSKSTGSSWLTSLSSSSANTTTRRSAALRWRRFRPGSGSCRTRS